MHLILHLLSAHASQSVKLNPTESHTKLNSYFTIFTANFKCQDVGTLKSCSVVKSNGLVRKLGCSSAWATALCSPSSKSVAWRVKLRPLRLLTVSVIPRKRIHGGHRKTDQVPQKLPKNCGRIVENKIFGPTLWSLPKLTLFTGEYAAQR